MKEITVRIGGMTCDGCEATIRKALLKLDGIYDARANHKTGHVWVGINESSCRIAEIDRTIRNLGYQPEEI